MVQPLLVGRLSSLSGMGLFMSDNHHQVVTIRHWLPIMTFCPVNHLPDFVYCSVTFEGDAVNELYAVRKRMRQVVSGQKAFMETLARDLARAFPTASIATVTLMFNRHEVTIINEGA